MVNNQHRLAMRQAALRKTNYCKESKYLSRSTTLLTSSRRCNCSFETGRFAARKKEKPTGSNSAPYWAAYNVSSLMRSSSVEREVALVALRLLLFVVLLVRVRLAW